MDIKKWLVDNFNGNKGTAIKTLNLGIQHFEAIAKSEHSADGEKKFARAKLEETQKYLDALTD